MPTGARVDADLVRGLEEWAAACAPEGGPVTVAALRRPSSGWSNDTLLVVVARPDGSDEVVVRLPTAIPSFPVYDLAAQSAVQQALLDAGIPAARPLAVECDARWLGAPFLVMEMAPGRTVCETPALDPWLTAATLQTQRALHEAFLALLGAVHRLDWRRAGLGAVLRGARGDLGDEVAWWLGYIDWAADGTPAPSLLRLAEWCAATAPVDPSGRSLCWGDARLGNALVDDGGAVVAALDWELASIGPAEMDLAWYLSLDELTTRVVGRTVPGFLPREELIACYEEHLGRPVHHLRWHEIFALVRSAAINDRQARNAAVLGTPYPGVAGEDNPVLAYIARRIDRYQPGT